jgi:hypothetical protein
MKDDCRYDEPGFLPHDKFVHALCDGMHALAQPLTIVQGELELALVQPRSAKEYRETVIAALHYTQSAIKVMKNIQELLCVQPPSDVANVSSLKRSERTI